MTIKDVVTPIITVVTLLAGIAYSSGIRDEKITNLTQNYQELREELKTLRFSIDQLRETIKVSNTGEAADRKQRTEDRLKH